MYDKKMFENNICTFVIFQILFPYQNNELKVIVNYSMEISCVKHDLNILEA